MQSKRHKYNHHAMFRASHTGSILLDFYTDDDFVTGTYHDKQVSESIKVFWHDHLYKHWDTVNLYDINTDELIAFPCKDYEFFHPI